MIICCLAGVNRSALVAGAALLVFGEGDDQGHSDITNDCSLLDIVRRIKTKRGESVDLDSQQSMCQAIDRCWDLRYNICSL